MGLITLLVCCCGYVFSWISWRKGNIKPALIFLILCGFILRFYTASDLFLHSWDECYHALVAKNLIQHPLESEKIHNGVLFNYSKPIDAMFYTNLTVYSTIPDKELILKLLKEGYTVLINDDGKIPISLAKMEFVTYEQSANP